jgi:hypothetical protein
MNRFAPGLLAGALGAVLFVPAFTPAFTQDARDAGGDDMAAMMAKAKQFTQPGEHHKELERFVGRWNTETRITMVGHDAPAEKGTAEFSWLMPGRWLKGETTGTVMGMPFDGFSITGYDNFKQSYVTTMVGNFDTAMIRAEGDMDPSGKALLLYGTLDEYLTGEHDKMVKTVWRFPSADKLVQEVHDLPIGEENTKVFEVVYTRAK